MRYLCLGLLLAGVVATIDAERDPHGREIFKTSDQCLACHNGLRTPAGEDVSIGTSWRASSIDSCDPYQ